MAVYSQLKYKTDLTTTDSSGPIVGRVRTLSQTTGLNVDGTPNAEPEEDQSYTSPIRITGSRKFGIIARHLVIYQLVGTSPNQFRSYRRVPILDPANYVLYISTIPSTIGYEGSNGWILVGGIGEKHHLAYGAP
jgi:hypothetical protein